MDNALIIDGVIAVALIAGTAIGANRGLFKSLMGLVTVIAALVGATVLADMLTPAAAELLYPLVRESMLERVGESLPAALGGFAELQPVEQAARSLLESTVHAALLLALYLVLLIALKLLTRALDRVFDLPVLSALNGFSGAFLGFFEAYFLLFVAINVASRLGVSWLGEHLEDSRLLPFFLNLDPIGLLRNL